MLYTMPYTMLYIMPFGNLPCHLCHLSHSYHPCHLLTLAISSPVSFLPSLSSLSPHHPSQPFHHVTSSFHSPCIFVTLLPLKPWSPISHCHSCYPCHFRKLLAIARFIYPFTLQLLMPCCTFLVRSVVCGRGSSLNMCLIDLLRLWLFIQHVLDPDEKYSKV